ncbi:MAG: Holliday junction branch migration DNA helicase RuvB, partial [Elusimicrobia bacterium]|nr:Holliday junction branch migration DNA helicase RuvB [Elusimicrobiota bacterium]
IGATTRAGFLSAPLRERFGLSYHLDFYAPEDLVLIVRRSAKLLSMDLIPEAALAIARRSRGTPRIANRLLRRVRDFAEVRASGQIRISTVEESLKIEGIDEWGLDELDKKYISVILQHHDGGPVGIESIAATLNEESETLREIVEPYLLKIGLVSRTRMGRKVNESTLKQFNISTQPSQKAQGDLFSQS